MIGRVPLRGPCNGGKEGCPISTFRDNITNYGESLAFTRVQVPWKAQGTTAARVVEQMSSPPTSTGRRLRDLDARVLVTALCGCRQDPARWCVGCYFSWAAVGTGGRRDPGPSAPPAPRYANCVSASTAGRASHSASASRPSTRGPYPAEQGVPDGDWSSRSFDERIVAATEAVSRARWRPVSKGASCHVVIDEVEDLVDVRREMVEELLERSSADMRVHGRCGCRRERHGFQVADPEQRAQQAVPLQDWSRRRRATWSKSTSATTSCAPKHTRNIRAAVRPTETASFPMICGEVLGGRTTQDGYLLGRPWLGTDFGELLPILRQGTPRVKLPGKSCRSVPRRWARYRGFPSRRSARRATYPHSSARPATSQLPSRSTDTLPAP